MATHLLML